jgi:DNA-binding cell septation regulator SpoVG
MSNPFKVSVRLIDTGSALLGKADVQGQKMTINGFSIMAGKDGKPPWVAEPSTKAGSGFVKVVEITDKATKDLITKLVLEAYQKAVAERGAMPEGDEEAAF